MGEKLKGVEPVVIWDIFSELCSIPRPSGVKEGIIKYFVDFGEKHGIVTEVDEIGNVLMKKSASTGMENRKTVIFQGHMDMVPQKNSDVDHDFATDPINAYIDGDWITAEGTTLGADNGIGVAASLALLKADDVSHGPIEVLITVDEESGMTGAFELGKDFMKGEILMNLDSEEEGELCIGCAGGMDTKAIIPIKREKTPDGYTALRLDIKNLRGGHSGVDIHLMRGNSNKLLNRILWTMDRKFDIYVSNFEGGNLRNAIPREAWAELIVKNEHKDKCLSLVDSMIEDINEEFKTPDPEINISYAEIKLPEKVISKSVRVVLNSIYACPNGVMRMVPEMPEIVQLSSNLAIIKSGLTSVEISTMQRSSVNSLRDDLAAMIRSSFELAGGQVEHSGAYPGWNPNVDSEILEVMKNTYKKVFDRDAEVKVIHAGLECGLIRDKYPKMDCISFGPTIKFPHSPDEKVNIKSVENFWKYLIETLKNIPTKN